MASADELRTSYTEQFGRTLVGSAQLEPETVQWMGSETVDSLIISEPSRSFGYSGVSSYKTEAIVPNQWVYELSGSLAIGSARPSGMAPSIGRYFAPEKAGMNSSTCHYKIQVGGQLIDKTVDGRGEAVDDNDSSPAITLNVTTRGAQSEEGQRLTVPNSDGTVVFSVTPRVNAGLVPAGCAPVQYVIVELLVEEKNTGCSTNNTTFKDKGVTPNNFNPSQYYHYLDGSGPNVTPTGCIRTYSFLVSVDKAFEFQTTSQRTTGAGQVNYTFYVRGHYDISNASRWAGSHQRFELVASGEPVQRRRVNWPTLGHASLLNAAGAVQEIQTVAIYGGIERTGGSFLANGSTLSQAETINVGARIQVHPSHQGQSAEVLTVVSIQPNASTDPSYMQQAADGSFQPWDGNIANISSKASTSLSSELDIDIYNGPAIGIPTGIYTVFVGYRLADGTVIFNGSSPLRFNVAPA